MSKAGKTTKSVGVTQEEMMEISLISTINKAFSKCTPLCMKSQHFISSIPTSIERRCLSDCYEQSVVTSILFLGNLNKIQMKHKQFLKDEQTYMMNDPMNVGNAN